jgi:hypothetical protein
MARSTSELNIEFGAWKAVKSPAAVLEKPTVNTS